MVYERVAVLRCWSLEPFYAPKGADDDTLVFESLFESGNLRRRTWGRPRACPPRGVKLFVQAAVEPGEGEPALVDRFLEGGQAVLEGQIATVVRGLPLP